ncbi:methyltransferase [Pelistega sp. MC2]|uniref:methyltransferase n=1 Tax=Pelistega sp. MC2 TaxID=1720297 RepID=UPI0008D95D2C|nr:methyltransferase [Pelistega sp. MC2]
MNSHLNVPQLHSLIFNFRLSRAVLSALEVGVFDVLVSHNASSLEEIATHTQTDKTSIELVLNCLVAWGILEIQESGKYLLPSHLLNYFDCSSSQSIKNLLLFDATRSKNWDTLSEKIKNKKPKKTIDDDVLYYQAMSEGLYHFPIKICDYIFKNFPTIDSICDVGGAKGGVITHILQTMPNISIKVLDNNRKLLQDKNFLATLKINKQINFFLMDILHKEKYSFKNLKSDLVLLSRFLMGFSRDDVLTILSNSKRLLNDSGVLIIHEFDEKTKVGSLMHLDMFANNRRIPYKKNELKKLVTSLGFSLFDDYKVSNYSYLLVFKMKRG